MIKEKATLRKPRNEFRKQLRLKIITNPKDRNNDYEGSAASDFQEGGKSPNTSFELLNLKVSGKRNNILIFIVEDYFKDVTDAAIKFSERFTYLDYEISDVIFK
jgi:hypothetical protein